MSFRLFGIALGLLSVPALAQKMPEPTGDEAVEEVVITGIPPRCRPRAGDPQDLVDLSGAAGARQQQLIRIDPATGRHGLFPDDYPTGTRDQWQRDGTGLDNYVFRVPEDGGPLCIGARRRDADSFAQLRRSFPARPLWGRYVILTASVAARKVGRVDMWIAAGAPVTPGRPIETNIVAGGPKRVPLKGNYELRTVNFLMGPIPCMAEQVSYGLTLRGGGDVWLSNPQFVEIPETNLAPWMRERSHGAEMLEKDPICRHILAGDRLYRSVGVNFEPVTSDRDLVPGAILFTRHEVDPTARSVRRRGSLYRQDGDVYLPMNQAEIRKHRGSAWQFEMLDYSQSFAPGLVEF